MESRTALVTGANGEMGHLLLPALRRSGFDLVSLDLQPAPETIAAHCRVTVAGSVADRELMAGLFRDHRPAAVFHSRRRPSAIPISRTTSTSPPR